MRDYLALLKPRVMSLVVFTALTGLVVAPGAVHPVLGFMAVLCIAVGAGASGALNMWYDADIDALMERTAGRPIPAGRVSRGDALGLGLGLSMASVMTLGVLVNWLAAGLLAFTIAFYIVVYTMWLKRRTPQNIVIGGAAGALPPVVAWAAATGSLGWGAAALFALIFLWTPPHFWALALLKSGEYKKSGVPMLPVVAGEARTRREILIYSFLVAGAGLLPWATGIAGPLYAAAATALGLMFIAFAVLVWRRPEPVWPQRLYGFSILYLFLLFAFLLVGGGAGA
ncbi:MAG: heme o synthase [Proteobacteria bacterium]|nr:heme o synthase [Pseudomonadota bacterium]